MEPQKRGAPDLRAHRSSQISAAYEETYFDHTSAAAVLARERAAERHGRFRRPAAGNRARQERKKSAFISADADTLPKYIDSTA